MPGNERRPEQKPGAAETFGGVETKVQPTALNHPKAVAPAYAVFSFHDDGRVKRRFLYLSLHSAIKAQERAEAKGERFELMLVELVPVPATPVLVVEGGAA